ncbi:glycerophosphodiester phosphodiesterase [Halobaculum sp. D14]|uniref:glycerophosphodiester phosphodiesterase n=1 Tax=unclassified Halobaculum TaxID=2640896 RepID=UPI003EBA517B
MTRRIAHRGFAGVAPENTVAAAVAAAEHADAVEVDAQLSADGDAVLFHDDRLDDRAGSRGVTDGDGYVWESTAADLADLSVFDSGEPVPTLRDLFDALPDDTAVNVELKNPGRTDLRPGELLDDAARLERAGVWRPLVDAVADAAAEADNDVLLSSFCEGALAAARDATPETPLAVLLWDDPDAGLALARRYDADAIHPPKTAVGDARIDDAHLPPRSAFGGTDLVGVAADEGYDVNVWTVTTWREADALRDAGVDGIIADYPGLGWRTE